MADNRMPAHDRREQREADIGKAVAVEVVDEPPCFRIDVHEADEGDQLFMRHMVRDEA